jgi:hypothetical protein
MSVPANIETVFSPNYWEPISPIHQYRARTEVGKVIESLREVETMSMPPRFSKKAREGIEERLALAVTSMVKDETFEAVKDAEWIGGDLDDTNALPGAVILLDTEYLMLKSNVKETNSLRMTHAADIGLSAVSCLMADMNRRSQSGGQAPLKRYIRQLTLPGAGRYFRHINMFGFGVDRKGNVGGVGIDQMVIGSNRAHTLSGFLGDWFNGRDGRQVGVTNNVTRNEEVPMYSRIREARLCLAGTREAVKVKSKQRHMQRALRPIASY